MPTLRLNGGSNVTRAPSIHTSPSVGTAKPAMHASVVVLPDPDGPSSVRNSPGRAVRVTPSTARVAPKVLTRPSMRTSAPLAARSLGTAAAIDALHPIEGPLPRHDELEHRPPPAVERHRPQRALREDGSAPMEHAIGQDLPHDRRHRHAAPVVSERG